MVINHFLIVNLYGPSQKTGSRSDSGGFANVNNNYRNGNLSL
jgi:hypothetical protein